MKKTEFKIKNILYDNRFLMLLSVFVAIALWAVVVVVYSPETEKKIEDVPVKIEASGLAQSGGLKAYLDADYKIDVVVSGKRIVVDSAEEIKDDLVVYANTSFVTSSGDHTLKLEVSSESASPQYEIVSLSPEEIVVYFDTESQKTFKIEPDISYETQLTADGYVVGDTSVLGVDTVTVTGPQNKINQIEHVYAKAVIDEPLTANTTVQAELAAVDENGNSIKYIKITRESNVNVNISVSRQAEYETKVEFTNPPSAYIDAEMPFVYSIDPATAVFAADESVLGENADEIVIGKIDFSQIKPGENLIEIDTAELVGAEIVNGAEVFAVTVTADGVSSKVINNILPPADDSVYQSKPENRTVTFVSYNFETVTVVGPDSSISAYTPENLNLVIDLYDVGAEESGVVTVPVKLADDDCWLYGDYTATIEIS